MNKILLLITTAFVVSCSTTQKVVQTNVSKPVETQTNLPVEKSLKRKVAIARFSNETSYAKGIFYDKKNDPLGKQALDILSTKLTSSGKFILLERESLKHIMKENKLDDDISFEKVGADYIIVGSLTQYGRKHIGDVNVFTNSKTQIVEAGVSLRLIDTRTGQIIYSEEAKGESQLKTKNVLGLGENASYDSSLADKAISAAVTKLVENVINNCMDRPWKSYFLSYEEDGIIISGGKSQNIEVGNKFDVLLKGKRIKNPQTGMFIELPGKKIGEVEVILSAGDLPESEYSIVNLINGSVDKEKLSNYIISEKKKS